MMHMRKFRLLQKAKIIMQRMTIPSIPYWLILELLQFYLLPSRTTAFSMNEALIYAITDGTILMRLCQFLVGWDSFGGLWQLWWVRTVVMGWENFWWVWSNLAGW
jgi:hypothetical protein